MLKLSSVLASVGVAKALTQAQINNECYDFWNKLEETGVGEFDELNTEVGANINGGTSTAVGTGGGLNFGRFHLAHATTNSDGFTVPVAEGTPGVRSMNAGVGSNVGLAGSQSTAVDTGVGITDLNAITNIDLFSGGDFNNLNMPGFQNMNGGLGNENMGLGSVIHRQGTGYTTGHATQYGGNSAYGGSPAGGLRRRLMAEMCGPPPAKGGKSVTCASTGDPHIVDFRGNKFDDMAFGEFIFYNAWEPFSHHPRTSLKIHVRTGPFNGSPVVASNHGVAIGGNLLCGNHYEILKEGSAQSQLKIRRRSGQIIRVNGRDQIYATLARESCPQVTIQNNVAHMVFEEEGDERTTLRVQIVSYGLNLGLDVLGKTVRMDTDRGVCTKNAGWDMQLECSHSLFTMYPNNDCNQLRRGGHRGGPAVECPDQLFQAATKVCGKCPRTVNPKGCVYDICALGDISYADEVLSACNVGMRLPARMSVGTGVNVNMEGGVSIAVQRGSGINRGVTNVRVNDFN